MVALQYQKFHLTLKHDFVIIYSLIWRFIFNVYSYVWLISNRCHCLGIHLAWAWVDSTFNLGTVWLWWDQIDLGGRLIFAGAVKILVKITSTHSLLSLCLLTYISQLCLINNLLHKSHVYKDKILVTKCLCCIMTYF